MFLPIEEKIKQELESFINNTKVNKMIGNKAWTNNIKQTLAKLGKDEGYSVCCSGFKDIYEAEWMWDLVWYIEEGTGQEARLIDVPLVAECEWNRSFTHIKYDFEKLLASNATLRLMICDTNEKNREFLFSYFKEAVNKYKLGKINDRYLIVFLDTHEELFSYEIITKGSFYNSSNI